MERTAPGDFLPLDSCSLNPDFADGRVVLTIHQTPFFRGKLKEGKLKIIEYPIFQEVNTMEEDEDEEFDEDITSFEEEETSHLENEDEEELPSPEENEDEELETFEEEEPLSPPQPPPEKPIPTEEIPLPIVIEAGRLKMSVAQLVQLEPGNLLELDIHPENGVDLTVHGRCVARGELIQIGDVLGVRILEKG